MEGLHCEILTPKDLSVLEKDEVWGRFDLAYGTFFFWNTFFRKKNNNNVGNWDVCASGKVLGNPDNSISPWPCLPRTCGQDLTCYKDPVPLMTH